MDPLQCVPYFFSILRRCMTSHVHLLNEGGRSLFFWSNFTSMTWVIFSLLALCYVEELLGRCRPVGRAPHRDIIIPNPVNFLQHMVQGEVLRREPPPNALSCNRSRLQLGGDHMCALLETLMNAQRDERHSWHHTPPPPPSHSNNFFILSLNSRN